jgi:hypothetical protein
MPIIISDANIEGKLSDLRGLIEVILQWNKDLKSAIKAKTSLEKYQELSSAIVNYIQQELSKKPNEKKGARLVSYREELQSIKDNFSTKGRTNQINRKIEEIETAHATLQNEVEKKESQSEAALVEINKLLPLVTSIVDAYEQARIEDKEGLHAQFIQQRALLNEQISLLSDKGAYSKQVNDLSQRVNQRTIVLAKEEELIKTKIVAEAKAAEKVVHSMTVNEQLLAIAPSGVQEAVRKLLASVTTIELKQLLSGSDVTEDAVNQIVAVTGKKSSIGQELVAISKLSQAEQLQLVQALLTGQSNELTTNVSQSTQLALTAASINQLAINANVSENDLVAIQKFSNNIVSSMARVETGEATHLSVLVKVENSNGESEIRGFHIDLQSLIKNPVNFSALMAFQLLQIGAKRDTPLVTAFTSKVQVGTLIHLQGRVSDKLALNGDLQAIIVKVLQNVSALKQITGDEVVDVSDTALVGVTQHHKSIVTQTLGLTGGKGTDLKSSGIVVDVLKALTIMQLTALATVFDLNSQNKLGITSLIGNKFISSNNALGIEGGYTNTIAVTAATEQGLTDVHNVVEKKLSSPPPVITVTGVKEVTDVVDVNKKEEPELSVVRPKKKVNFVTEPLAKKPVINQQLVDDFTAALTKLETLHTSLDIKYGKNKDTQYIVKTSMSLMTSLKTALKEYKGHGNTQTFQDACEAAIDNEVKSAFNTHRDGAIKQFFGAIAEAFSNLWAKLFASKEQNEARNATRAGAAGFFQSQAKTKSAKVLFDFNNDMNKAFELVIDIEIDDDLDQGHVIRHRAH